MSPLDLSIADTAHLVFVTGVLFVTGVIASVSSLAVSVVAAHFLHAWVALLCFFIIFSLRLFLVIKGYVSADEYVGAFDFVVAAAAALAVYGFRDRLGVSGATPEQRLSLVAAVLAIPVGAVAAVPLVSPAARAGSVPNVSSVSTVTASVNPSRISSFRFLTSGGRGCATRIHMWPQVPRSPSVPRSPWGGAGGIVS